jgi:hypothetical protein
VHGRRLHRALLKSPPPAQALIVAASSPSAGATSPEHAPDSFIGSSDLLAPRQGSVVRTQRTEPLAHAHRADSRPAGNRGHRRLYAAIYCISPHQPLGATPWVPVQGPGRAILLTWEDYAGDSQISIASVDRSKRHWKYARDVPQSPASRPCGSWKCAQDCRSHLARLNQSIARRGVQCSCPLR